MPADPLAEYFTPERRGRFEELRERYPHWCLVWPRVAAIGASVTPSQRLSVAVEEMKEDLEDPTVWESPPALGGDLQCQMWMDGETVHGGVVEFEDSNESIGKIYVDVPSAHLALFASIEHILHSDQSSSERDRRLGEWHKEIQGILINDPGHADTRLRLWQLSDRAGSTSALAAQGGRPQEREKRQARAKTAAKRLRSYWHEIGQAIGLIPTRRGGKTDLIPDNWIFEFAEQAQELLAAVRVYEPDTRERDAVRALLLAEPYPAGSGYKRVMAQEYVRKGQGYTPWDKQVGLTEWCLRLAFPMLTAEELLTGLSTTTSWRWLPADRLGLDEDALSKRLSQYRHRS